MAGKKRPVNELTPHLVDLGNGHYAQAMCLVTPDHLNGIGLGGTGGGGTGAAGPAGPAGPAGASGTNGTNGSSALSGLGAPAAGLGAVNDTYVDVTANGTGNVYKKTAATVWTVIGSLKGPQGTQGAQGPQGAAGAAGPAGATGPQGPQGTPGTSASADPLAAKKYRFRVNFDASGNPTTTAEMPAGWSASVVGNEVTVTHNAATNAKVISYLGWNSADTSFHYRMAVNSSDIVIKTLAALDTQFTIKPTSSLTGAGASEYAYINVVF